MSYGENSSVWGAYVRLVWDPYVRATRPYILCIYIYICVYVYTHICKEFRSGLVCTYIYIYIDTVNK